MRLNAWGKGKVKILVKSSKNEGNGMGMKFRLKHTSFTHNQHLKCDKESFTFFIFEWWNLVASYFFYGLFCFLFGVLIAFKLLQLSILVMNNIELASSPLFFFFFFFNPCRLSPSHYHIFPLSNIISKLFVKVNCHLPLRLYDFYKLFTFHDNFQGGYFLLGMAILY